MVIENRDLGAAGEGRPVGQLTRHVLVIVQDGNTDHFRGTPYGLSGASTPTARSHCGVGGTSLRRSRSNRPMTNSAVQAIVPSARTLMRHTPPMNVTHNPVVALADSASARCAMARRALSV